MVVPTLKHPALGSRVDTSSLIVHKIGFLSLFFPSTLSEPLENVLSFENNKLLCHGYCPSFHNDVFSKKRGELSPIRIKGMTQKHRKQTHPGYD